MMGSPRGEKGRYRNEGPVHRVTLSKPIAVGVYEVTRGEWSVFASETGHSAGSSCLMDEGGQWKKQSGSGWRNPGFSQEEREPVVCVSWEDTQAYVGMVVEEDGTRVSVIERVGVGVCGPGRDEHVAVLGGEEEGSVPTCERDGPGSEEEIRRLELDNRVMR